MQHRPGLQKEPPKEKHNFDVELRVLRLLLYSAVWLVHSCHLDRRFDCETSLMNVVSQCLQSGLAMACRVFRPRMEERLLLVVPKVEQELDLGLQQLLLTEAEQVLDLEHLSR